METSLQAPQGGATANPREPNLHFYSAELFKTPRLNRSYVVEGRNPLERLFWTAAICASFAVSLLMAAAALRDAARNPVATSLETLPVQVENVLPLPRLITYARIRFLEKIANCRTD